MDILLFIRVVAWIVFVVYGIKFLMGVASFVYYEMTSAGQHDQWVMRCRGEVITGYPILNNLVPLAIAVALLISLN